MAIKDIRSVTASEFKMHFGLFREAAQREPIGITSHGRVSAVMISAQEYERLVQIDRRGSLYAHELDEETMGQLEDAEMDPKHDHLNDLLK
ncbi:MAG: type II toxin-antitoxin system prevent-host-death family antitoxin [Alphaproteobacteria bacterium]